MKSQLLTMATAIFLLSACMPSTELKPFGENPRSTVVDKSQLSYALVNDRVLATRCVTCHQSGNARGRTNLETYELVLAKLERVRIRAIVEKTMPDDRPLTFEEEELLRAWIEAGAPREPGGIATPPPTPTPTPTPEATPLPTPQPTPEPLPNFSMIRSTIFSARCLNCHAPGESGEDVPLDTIDDLVSGEMPLVIPGDPNNSLLIKSIERRPGAKAMPPRRFPALSSDEIQIIRTWIQNGAAN